MYYYVFTIHRQHWPLRIALKFTNMGYIWMECEPMLYQAKYPNLERLQRHREVCSKLSLLGSKTSFFVRLLRRPLKDLVESGGFVYKDYIIPNIA